MAECRCCKRELNDLEIRGPWEPCGGAWSGKWEWGYCQCGYPVFKCLACGEVFPETWELGEDGMAVVDAKGYQIETTEHECRGC